MYAELVKTFHIEAAHFLPNVDFHHKCKNTHGHSYKITLRAFGPMDPKYGWVMDLAVLSKKFEPLKKILDHAMLNKISGLENPTSENLALWIIKKLKPEIPLLSSVSIQATNNVMVTVKTNKAENNL